MLKIFRGISLIEGLSFLLILCVTLNIISRDFVQVLGMGHGVLFMIYIVFAFLTWHKEKWSFLTFILILLASLVPFAFIAVEVFVQKELKNSHKSEVA
ncbi:DUF3817 domain-containing protein [Pseudocolwellia agarivorans]|uniref:DUF3817 domain-containing protein n=1 Tax=Pseudocolwellia agarivorans TaxID=1911682 RepID=UPI003F882082